MDAMKKKKVSFKKYLEIEQNEGVKYEFHRGEVYAMAGGSNAHGRICRNISAELHSMVSKKSGPCESFSSENKLYIPSEDRAFYPDAMVICENDKENGRAHYLTNPTVIIEVLSDSTEIYDRTDKFRYYRKIPTLREYILISQKTADVEVYKKVSDLWHTRFITGLEEKLYIKILDIEISLKDIYLNINFDTKEP